MKSWDEIKRETQSVCISEELEKILVFELETKEHSDAARCTFFATFNLITQLIPIQMRNPEWSTDHGSWIETWNATRGQTWNRVRDNTEYFIYKTTKNANAQQHL